MAFLAKRLVASALFFIFFSMAMFAIARAMPGSMAQFYFANSAIDSYDLAELQHFFEGRKPLITAYGHWLAGLIKGDLGFSISRQQPIGDAIKESLVASIVLTWPALLMAFMASIPLAVVLARYRHHQLARKAYLFCLILVSVPSLFLSLLFQYLLAIRFHLLPINSSLPTANALLMPQLVIFITNATFFTRAIRALVIKQLKKPYYRYGHYLGLKGYYFYRYWLIKPILPAVLVLFNGQLIASMSGMLLLESLFDYHGMGQLLYQSVISRDVPLLMAGTVIFFIISSLLYLVADWGSYLLDRRSQ